MNVQVKIPDEVFSPENKETSRQILEIVTLEGYRSGQLTAAQVRRILGFETLQEVYDFLAKNGVLGLIIQLKTPNAKEICCKNLRFK